MNNLLQLNLSALKMCLSKSKNDLPWKFTLLNLLTELFTSQLLAHWDTGTNTSFCSATSAYLAQHVPVKVILLMAYPSVSGRIITLNSFASAFVGRLLISSAGNQI